MKIKAEGHGMSEAVSRFLESLDKLSQQRIIGLLEARYCQESRGVQPLPETLTAGQKVLFAKIVGSLDGLELPAANTVVSAMKQGFPPPLLGRRDIAGVRQAHWAPPPSNA
jgi:hypothetical protein